MGRINVTSTIFEGLSGPNNMIAFRSGHGSVSQNTYAKWPIASFMHMFN